MHMVVTESSFGMAKWISKPLMSDFQTYLSNACENAAFFDADSNEYAFF